MLIFAFPRRARTRLTNCESGDRIRTCDLVVPNHAIAMLRHTPDEFSRSKARDNPQYPVKESNLVSDVRSVVCVHHTHRVRGFRLTGRAFSHGLEQNHDALDSGLCLRASSAGAHIRTGIPVVGASAFKIFPSRTVATSGLATSGLATTDLFTAT